MNAKTDLVAIKRWRPQVPPSVVAWFGERYAPSRAIIFQATSIWAATRIGLMVLTWFALLLHRSLLAPTTNPVIGLAQIFQTWNTAWDGTAYRTIAFQGYPASITSYATFFPLYPILIALAAHVVGMLLAPMVVSNLATLAAFIGLGFLCAHESGDGSAVRPTLRALACYPLAFFLLAPYPESLTVACIVWGLLWMRQERWYLAALAAFLAPLARQTGVLLFLPLVFEYARQHDWGRAIRWRQVPELAACLLAAPAAIGVYSIFIWAYYGKPYYWITKQKNWGFHFKLPWQGLFEAVRYYLTLPAGSYSQGRLLIDLIPLLVVLAIAIATARSQPWAFTLFLIALVVVMLSSPVVGNGMDVHYSATGRHMLVAAPAFLVIGQWMRRYHWLDTFVTSGGFLLQAAFASYFLLGGRLV